MKQIRIATSIKSISSEFVFLLPFKYFVQIMLVDLAELTYQMNPTCNIYFNKCTLIRRNVAISPNLAILRDMLKIYCLKPT